MFGVFEQYLPKFHTYTKTKKLDIILNGFDRDNNDLWTREQHCKNTVVKESFVSENCDHLNMIALTLFVSNTCFLTCFHVPKIYILRGLDFSLRPP